MTRRNKAGIDHRDMYCRYFVFVFSIGVLDALWLKKDILKYYDSESIAHFKREWQHHRKAIEVKITNALQAQTLQEITNHTKKVALAQSFYHSHGRVQMALNNVQLAEMPHFWLPKVSLQLAENIFKLETRLTDMVINADYTLTRNKSDLVVDANKQDAFRNTQFRFQPIQMIGHLNLFLESCMLSGYIFVKLDGKSVKLGHNRLSLKECDFNVEPSTRAPMIVARLSANALENGFGIKNLLMQNLKRNVMKKIRTAVVENFDSTAISELNIASLQENQTIIFRKTRNILTSLVRQLNKETVDMNGGIFSLDDYLTSWDEFTPYSLDKFSSGQNKDIGSIKLSNMVLTGLNTAYVSNCGGPYESDRVMIGEQIRFHSLKVQGDILNTVLRQANAKFSVCVNDFTVNLDIHVQSEESLQMEVVGYRSLVFSKPRIEFKPTEGIIIGYLMNIIPKIISNITKLDLSRDIPERQFPLLDDICRL